MSLNYFQSRVHQGKINEEFYKPIIEKDINTTLQSNNQFNLFDFTNDNFKIELKTREVERMKNIRLLLDMIRERKDYNLLKKEKKFYFILVLKMMVYLNLNLQMKIIRFKNE